MHHKTNTSSEICPSCGSTFQGKFCHNCGEKVFHPSDLGLKKFTLQTVDIFTHFDSKFIRSVKYLMLRPGFLVKAYITGNRVKYAKPMQVFVLANILFYFVTHIIGVTDYSPNFVDHKYFGISDYWIFSWAGWLDTYISTAIDNLGTWKQHQLHVSDEQFSKTFFENSWIYSKTFIILLIPMYALTSWLAYIKRFRFFGEAVVFAIYFLSFQLITFSVASIFIKGFHIDIFQPFDWLFFETPLKAVTRLFVDGTFELEMMLMWCPYLYISIQKIYNGNVIITFIISFILSRVLFFLTFGVYKKILITLTVLLMHHI